MEGDGIVDHGVTDIFDEMAGLHEHARRAAGRIEHEAVIRLDDVNNHAHQRRWCEEFPALLRAAHGELVEEVFVNAPEHIAGGGLDGGAVENLDQFGQQIRLEGGIATRQGTGQNRVFGLDRVHGSVDDLAHLGPLRQADDSVKTRRLGQVNGRLALKTEFDQCFALGGRHLRRDVGFDVRQVGFETVVGVAQEDQAQHRHRVFGGGELGVGAQLVSGFPQFVFELLHVHALFSLFCSADALLSSSAPPERTHSSTSVSWNFHSRPILCAGSPLRSRQR